MTGLESYSVQTIYVTVINVLSAFDMSVLTYIKFCFFLMLGMHSRKSADEA